MFEISLPDERKAEQHRILLDLASHFGYIVVSPAELVEMVSVAAAKRPVRVQEVDAAIDLFQGLIAKIEKDTGLEPFKGTVGLVLGMYLKDLQTEVAKRGV